MATAAYLQVRKDGCDGEYRDKGDTSNGGSGAGGTGCVFDSCCAPGRVSCCIAIHAGSLGDGRRVCASHASQVEAAQVIQSAMHLRCPKRDSRCSRPAEGETVDTGCPIEVDAVLSAFRAKARIDCGYDLLLRCRNDANLQTIPDQLLCKDAQGGNV